MRLGKPFSPRALNITLFTLFIAVGMALDWHIGTIGYAGTIMMTVAAFYMLGWILWLQNNKMKVMKIQPMEFAGPLYGRLVALMGWPIFIFTIFIPFGVAEYLKAHGLLAWLKFGDTDLTYAMPMAVLIPLVFGLLLFPVYCIYKSGLKGEHFGIEEMASSRLFLDKRLSNKVRSNIALYMSALSGVVAAAIWIRASQIGFDSGGDVLAYLLISVFYSLIVLVFGVTLRLKK